MNITTEFSIGDRVVFIAGSEVHYGAVSGLEVTVPNSNSIATVIYSVRITASNRYETGAFHSVNETKMAKDKPSLMHKL